MIATKDISVFTRQYRRDPTRTQSLRVAFTRDMRKRFVRIRGLIRRAIVEQDVFGLVGKDDVLQPTINRSNGISVYDLPGRRAFDFTRSSKKVEEFMAWLNHEVNRGMLETVKMRQLGEATEEAWTSLYVKDSYKRGVQRSRREMKRAGLPVPSLDETGGISASMSTPFHMDRVGLMYTRTFEELKGITRQMDTQISRVLSQGIADGDNPRLLAEKLTKTISGPVGDLGITDTLGRFIPAERRAEMLARTEIIRAHHKGMMGEYRSWEVEGLYVQAEWNTAGDDRVCEECEDKEGLIGGERKTYTLDEAENMIPVHPQCRCIVLPIPVKIL